MARIPAPRLIVTPGLNQRLEAHPAVTKARTELAQRVSDRARQATAPGRTRESHRVETDTAPRVPYVAAVAGEGDAWPYIFQELGGSGWRPAPAPLRTAAKAEGNYRDTRR